MAYLENIWEEGRVIESVIVVDSSHLGKTDDRTLGACDLVLLEDLIVCRRRRGLAESWLVGRQREGYGKRSLDSLLLGGSKRQLGGRTGSSCRTLAAEVHLLSDLGKMALHVRLLPLHDQLVQCDQGNGEGEGEARSNCDGSGHLVDSSEVRNRRELLRDRRKGCADGR